MRAKISPAFVLYISSLPFAKNTKVSFLSAENYSKIASSNTGSIEYFCSAIRKLGLAKLQCEELKSFNKHGDSMKAECLFYTCIFLMSATLDSLANFLNAHYMLCIEEKDIYFNRDFFKNRSLPQGIFDKINDDMGWLEKMGFRAFRNAIEHRVAFMVVPVSKKTPQTDKEYCESYITFKNPADRFSLISAPIDTVDVKKIIEECFKRIDNIIYTVILEIIA